MLLSLASLTLPNVVDLATSHLADWLLVEFALLFTGAVLGCFRPERVWRWGLAAFMVIAVHDALIAYNMPHELTAEAVLTYAVNNVGVYMLKTIPVFVGSMFGAWTTKAGLG